MVSDLQFGILGPLEVTERGVVLARPAPRDRTLLALLVVYDGQVVTSDKLIDELWGDDLPRDPANALQACVSRLRKLLGSEVIQARPPGYILEVAPSQIDARRFERLVAEARQALAEDPAGAAERLASALALWRGPPLPELADTDTGRLEAARLEELRLGALEDRMEALLATGHHAEAASDLEALVRAHPLRERLWGQLMLALYRGGRQAEALRAYQEARRRLGEELGLEPSPELRQLEAAVLAHDPSLASPGATLPAPPLRRHNLPARATSFIGRWAERRDVAKLLGEHRLVTLTGPGGVGKTSLALEVAAENVGHREGGVWLVELAPLADPNLVMPTVAAALGVREAADGQAQGGQSLAERLAEYVAATEPLLVLDNCEHVVEACAALVARLLAAAPALRVVATSREPLHISGEVVYSLPPLALPDAAVGHEELAESDAVRLFVDRAAAVRPGFSLDPETAPVVAQICRRLDGIPLAIELAAARTGALPVAEVAARLNDRFRFLTSRRRDAAPRQHTLRAALDWSYELLSPPEQGLFRRLSVFAGSFALPAAEAVGAGTGIARDDVVDLVAGLVDRSLLVAEVGRGGRFRMLETVREYGRERLAEAGEADDAGRRHATYFREFAEDTDLQLPRRGGRWALQRLEQEEDELRAAIDWCLSHGEVECAQRLGGALGWFWFVSRRGEGARRLPAILAASDATPTWGRARALQAAALVGVFPPTPQTVEWAREALGIYEQLGDNDATARSKMLLGGALVSSGQLGEGERLLVEADAAFSDAADRWHQGVAWRILSWMRLVQGRHEEAMELGRRSLGRFRELDDPWGLSSALGQVAALATRRGDYTLARELYEEALAVARDIGLRDNVQLVLTELGTLAALAGDFEQAAALHEEALAAGHSMGPTLHLAHTWNAMGTAARRRGDLEAARAHHEWALDAYRTVGARGGIASSLSGLGFAHELAGDLDAAEARHREALATAHAVGDPLTVALALEGLAGVACATGRSGLGATLLGAAAAARERAGAPLPPPERAHVDRMSAGARSTLGETEFWKAYERGQELSLDEAVSAAQV